MLAAPAVAHQLTLSDAELRDLTGYAQPACQLRELHRQGFSRARRDRLGRVVLERAHYDAVAAGRLAEPSAPQLRTPSLA
jgi:hypothetical protein